MDAVLKAASITVLAAAVVFIGCLAGALVGALSGWAVSIIMPVWVVDGLAIIGISTSAEQLYKLGAALGFVGGFFRSSVGSGE